MALVTCPDCKKEVSDTAPTCPGCGRVLLTEPTITKPVGAPGVFVVLGVIAVVIDLWLHLAFTAWSAVGFVTVVIGGLLIAVRLAQK